MFYGSKSLPADERPPIPYASELDDPAWRPVYGEITFDAPHWGVFENVGPRLFVHAMSTDQYRNSLTQQNTRQIAWKLLRPPLLALSRPFHCLQSWQCRTFGVHKQHSCVVCQKALCKACRNAQVRQLPGCMQN